ncbi:hypothetical protein HJFPF1_06601 [Paramyrothecium foliicola]|nr:hypothetical protein HJFPF1_06601 [Paramyrothecium foliicola]
MWLYVNSTYPNHARTTNRGRLYAWGGRIQDDTLYMQVIYFDERFLCNTNVPQCHMPPGLAQVDAGGEIRKDCKEMEWLKTASRKDANQLLAYCTYIQ